MSLRPVCAWGAAATCLLLSLPSLGQPFSLSPTSGAALPAHATPADDRPTALSDSPGGLAFAQGFELDWLRSQAYAAQGLSADALFAAAGLGPLVLGASSEWFGEQAGARVRRLSLGLGLRLGLVGLGAARHSFSSADPALDHLASWDLGLMIRPARFLSLSFSALDVDAPRAGNSDVQRRWLVGAAVRPLGERLTLSAEAAFLTCPDNAGNLACGSGNPGWRFTAEVGVARGLRVIGQASRNAQLDTWSGQVGLAFDFSHFGLEYAQGLNDQQGTRGDFLLRFSSDKWPSAAPGGRAAVVKLDEALSPRGKGVVRLVLGGARRDPLADTLAALRGLARDPRVRAVVLRSSGLPGSLGKAEELRKGIRSLQAAGKKVVFFLESGGDLEYYVASAADRIIAAPQAVLAINGFSASALFAAEGLSKLGVKAEFVRVGAYKNAPDLFTRDQMSAEQREVENALLDDVYTRFVHEVAERRHLPEEKVKALLDRGLLRPDEALEGGLLDGLGYPDQLEEEVAKVVGRRVPLADAPVPAGPEREQRWGPRPRIALIRVEGTIAGGESKGNPLGMLATVGSETVGKQIRRAADDPRVRAIVVRIDSPGGDGNASDLIWRELVRARKEKGKPVVASMGDVAASGGYYVAVAADEIWAEPSTITGSIGVFFPKFDASGLFQKLGLHIETVKRGESADIFGTSRGFTASELKAVQQWVDHFYGIFLDRVAQGRSLTREQVDSVAQGRVWTGRQAKERKLVDELGGLDEALAAARKRAGLSPDAEVDVDDRGRASTVELADLAGAAPAEAAWHWGPLGALPRREAEQALRALQLVGEPGTLRAALPYVIDLH